MKPGEVLVFTSVLASQENLIDQKTGMKIEGKDGSLKTTLTNVYSEYGLTNKTTIGLNLGFTRYRYDNQDISSFNHFDVFTKFRILKRKHSVLTGIASQRMTFNDNISKIPILNHYYQFSEVGVIRGYSLVPFLGSYQGANGFFTLDARWRKIVNQDFDYEYFVNLTVGVPFSKTTVFLPQLFVSNRRYTDIGWQNDGISLKARLGVMFDAHKARSFIFGIEKQVGNTNNQQESVGLFVSYRIWADIGVPEY